MKKSSFVSSGKLDKHQELLVIRNPEPEGNLPKHKNLILAIWDKMEGTIMNAITREQYDGEVEIVRYVSRVPEDIKDKSFIVS